MDIVQFSLFDGKVCTSCRQWKPLSDYYKNGKQGLHTYCKACLSARKKAKYAGNPEAIKARQRLYNRAHAQEHAAYARRYRAANLDRTKLRDRAYHCSNKEHRNALTRAWRREHPDYMKSPERRNQAAERRAREDPETRRAYARHYRQQHPDRVRLYFRNYIARRRGQGGMITEQEWAALKAKYQHTCLRCGRKEPEILLTLDHVIPVSKGGKHSIENVQPLCKSCNSSKQDKSTDYRSANDLR